MVDFRKLLEEKADKVITDPIQIFKNLDKQSEKGYLRPAQEFVLREWYDHYLSKKDLMVKLHTGQGKTLIGLLILQSSAYFQKLYQI